MTAQQYDNAPEEVKNILGTFNEDLDAYKECELVIKKLNLIGWTADYYLDGILFDLQKI